MQHKNKLLTTLTITILTLSIILAAIPMASANSLVIHLDAVPEFETSSAEATAGWGTAPDTPATHGDYSAKLNLSSGAGGADYAYVRVYPGATGITINNLPDNIPTFEYYLTSGTTDHPDLEMRFLNPAGAGWVDITVFPTGTYEWNKTTGSWHTADGLDEGVFGVAYGQEPDNTAITREVSSDPLSDIIDYILGLDSAYGNWELTAVTPQLGWGQAVPIEAYIDNVKIAGVTYDLEPSGHVGDTVTVSGKSTSLGGLIEVYWDSVKAWDGTAGLLADDYAVGTTYSIEITIPEAVAGNHFVIVKDVEAAEMISATFTVAPEIVLTPDVGVIEDTIDVNGTGFAGSEAVTVYFYNGTWPAGTMNMTVATATSGSLGSLVTSFEVPSNASDGIYTVRAVDASANFAEATITVEYYMTVAPTTGPPGITVDVSGRVEAEVDVEVTFGKDPVWLAAFETTSDVDGYFSGQYTIPLTMGEGTYQFKASWDTLEIEANFTVGPTPTITLVPDEDLVGEDVTVTGSDFSSKANVTVYFDTTEVNTTKTNTAGAFTCTFVVPTVAVGTYTVEAVDQYGASAEEDFKVLPAPVTVIETRATEYLRGDTISIYGNCSVAQDGAVLEITDPDERVFWTTSLTTGDWETVGGWELLEWGVKSIVDALPSDAPLGSWNFTAYDGATILDTNLFTVIERPTLATILDRIDELDVTLSGLITDAEGNLAVLIETEIGTVLASLDDIDAKIVGLDLGDIATLTTTVGTIKTSVESIDLTVTSIEGDVATIETALGTIEGKVTSIDGNVATIETDVGTITADISGIQEDVSEIPIEVEIPAGLTLAVYVAVIFAVIAAIAAIYSIIELRRKIA